MAQVFKIAKAFQSTNQETKEPEVVSTQGGEMHKWMFQVEGQTKPGWMQMLKKPENELKPGDEIYGIIDEWPGGKAKWVKQDRPQGVSAPATPASSPAQPQSAGTNFSGRDEELHAKVDFLIVLVEQLLESQGATPAERPAINQGLEGNAPIDLSEIPY